MMSECATGKKFIDGILLQKMLQILDIEMITNDINNSDITVSYLLSQK